MQEIAFIEFSSNNGKISYTAVTWLRDKRGWPAGPRKPAKPRLLCGSNEFSPRDNNVKLKPCA